MSTPAGQPSSVRRSRRAEDTRERLVAAAKSVFEDFGFVDARVAEMTRRAGTSYGSFYHYFDSKEEVFREVAVGVGEAITAGMDIIVDRESKARPRQRLAAAIRVHFEAYRREARILGVIDEASTRDPQVHEFWTAMLSNSRKTVTEGIAALQHRGLADPTLDPDIAAIALGSMTRRFAHEWLVLGHADCDFDTGVEQITQLYFNALKLRDRPSASWTT